MQTKKKIGAALVLLALALAIVPAAVFWFHVPVLALLTAGTLVAGTVTTTYQNTEVNSAGGPAPGGGYTGGTVPPTVVQMIGINSLVALINYADTDTLITITHDMQITALGLSCLQPYIRYYWQALAATTNTYPVLTFALTNSNVVTINKISAVGTGGTLVVQISRG
jgi:hypothetical protein